MHVLLALECNPLEKGGKQKRHKDGGLLGSLVRSCSQGEADAGIHVNIECPKKHVIADLNIMSGIHNEECLGKTIHLIADEHKCYWKQSCSVMLPRSKMITCETKKSIEPCPCFMEMPDFIMVTKAKCAKQKRTYKIRLIVSRLCLYISSEPSV